jgi:hypothetical protein
MSEVTVFSNLVIGILGGFLLIFIGFLWSRRRKLKKNMLTLASITEAAGIPPYRSSQPALRKEIARVRRYQHSLAVVVVCLRESTLNENGKLTKAVIGDNGAGANTNHSLSQVEFLLCGNILRDALREVDLIAYDGANNQFVILLPESNKVEAERAVQRLNKIIGKRISSQLAYGISEFPDEGLIVEDLVEKAIEALSSDSQMEYQLTSVDSNKLKPKG